MRRLPFVTLFLAALSLIASGCKQTTGPAGTGPLAPIGALSPVAAGQSTGLGPFGGNTRVTPPATGSYVAPNNYMGGVAPIGQSGAGFNTGAQNNDVIGSGVQVAGWTETNSVVNQSDILQPNSGPAAAINSSASRDPRSGGMQVIDLTGAPSPPGYRAATGYPAQGYPAATNYRNGFPAAEFPGTSTGQTYPNSQAPQFQSQPFPNQSFQAPAFQAPAFQNPSGFQRIDIPNRGEIASAPAPMQEFPNNATPILPRTAAAPVQGPSTEPVSPGLAGSQQNLPWRRPGTRF